MRHHSANRKFGREVGQRRALLKSLTRALVLEKKITTTLAKAKELRPIVEKLITKAKKGTLAARRDIISVSGSEEVAKVLVETLASNYKNRQGGYTRVLKLPPRAKDGAEMAIIEFV